MEMLHLLSRKQEIVDFALKGTEIDQIIKEIYGQ
jgi:hypothetical protein